MRMRKLVLRAETVRTLASVDLARVHGGLPMPSDEAGPCGLTLSWCPDTAYTCDRICDPWPPPPPP